MNADPEPEEIAKPAAPPVEGEEFLQAVRRLVHRRAAADPHMRFLDELLAERAAGQAPKNNSTPL